MDSSSCSSYTSSDDDDDPSPTVLRSARQSVRCETPDDGSQLEGAFSSFRTVFSLFNPVDEHIDVAELGMALQRSGAIANIALQLGLSWFEQDGVASYRLCSPDNVSGAREEHPLWPVAAGRCGQISFDGFLKVLMEDDYKLFIRGAANGEWPRSRFGSTRLCLPELLYFAAVFTRLGSHSVALKNATKRLAEQVPHSVCVAVCGLAVHSVCALQCLWPHSAAGGVCLWSAFTAIDTGHNACSLSVCLAGEEVPEVWSANGRHEEGVCWSTGREV